MCISYSIGLDVDVDIRYWIYQLLDMRYWILVDLIIWVNDHSSHDKFGYLGIIPQIPAIILP